MVSMIICSCLTLLTLKRWNLKENYQAIYHNNNFIVFYRTLTRCGEFPVVHRSILLKRLFCSCSELIILTHVTHGHIEINIGGL